MSREPSGRPDNPVLDALERDHGGVDGDTIFVMGAALGFFAGFFSFMGPFVWVAARWWLGRG